MKRILAFLVSMVLIVTSIAGCGSSKQQANNQSNGSKTVTVKFIHYKSDVSDAVQNVINKFESKYPNIKIEAQPISWDNYETLLKTKISGGDTIDIVALKADEFATTLEKNGDLVDLTNEPFMKNVQETPLKDYAINGKNYLLPIDNSPIGVFYNKKIYEDLGLSVPKTYEELMNNAKKIKEKGITPFALGWKDIWTLANFVSRDSVFEGFLKGNPNLGTEIMDGKTSFKNTSVLKNTILRTKDFMNYGNKDPFATDYNKSMDIFASGKTAMVFGGFWIVSAVRQRNPNFADNDLGFFPYPATNDPNDVKLEATGDVNLAIGKNSKVKAQALKFLNFMASKEGSDAWVENVKTLSQMKNAKLDFEPVLKDMKPFFDSGNTWDVNKYYAQIPGVWDNEFAKYIEQYLLGQMNEGQVLDSMDSYIKTLRNK